MGRVYPLRRAGAPALLIALVVAGCGRGQGTGSVARFGPAPYVAERRYNQVGITIETPKDRYPYGQPVPVRVRLTNLTDAPLTLDTAGKPLLTDPPSTREGLEEPRPVYDLVVVGRTYQGGGVWRDEVWLWSRTTPTPPPSRLTLAPRETRMVIDTVWYPPPADGGLGEGYARVRLERSEFSTGIVTRLEERR